MRLFPPAGFSCTLVSAFLWTVAAAQAGDTWERFRGPNGSGVAAECGIPVQWTEKDWRWRVELPGVGHSSPVVRGTRVFITTADEKTGARRLQCRHTADGRLLWEKEYPGSPFSKNKLNSYASSTPALDGLRVFLALVTPDEYTVVALDQASGGQCWRRTLGGYAAEHGFGCSPIVVDGLLIVPIEQNPPEDPSAPKKKPAARKKPADAKAKIKPVADKAAAGPAAAAGPSTAAAAAVAGVSGSPAAAKPAERKSSIVALDCRTGEIRWQTPRASERAAYSTPCLYEPAGRPAQLIFTSSAQGFSSLDPKTGKANWELPLFHNRVVGSPIIAAGLILASSGSGGGGREMFAVRPGEAVKDVQPEQVYEVKPPIPYVPTSVCDGRRVFLCGDGGVCTCIEAASGKQLWQSRLDGKFFASPVLVGNRVYCVSRDGDMMVLAAADKFKLLAQFNLGEASNATPAVAGGVMYVRTVSHLMAIGGKP